MSICKTVAAALIGSAAFLGLYVLAPSPKPAMAQAKLVPMKVGVLKIAGLANAFAAKKEGMFEKNGLDVTLVEFRSGAEAVMAQQSGAVDIVLAIPGTAMTANERGFDFRAIFQNEIVYDQGPDSGSVQVLADSGINKLSELVGKKIAVAQISSQNAVTVLVALRKAGVDPSKVQFIEVPYPRHADILKSKQVDAVAATEPYTTQLISSGVGKVLSWNYAEAVPAAPLGVWFARLQYINKNPDLVNRFNRSIKESIDYMNADLPRARMRTVEFTGLDPVLVEKMPPLRFDYRVRPEKWQEVVNMMVEAKVLEKSHAADEYFAEQIKPFIQK
jgi:NitT/TauT family transport system substrate-binding protein